DITKVLSEADINVSRLFLDQSSVETNIFPLMDIGTLQQINNGGVAVNVWDRQTHTQHQLIFENAPSNGYYLRGNWTADFVHRRGLKKGDEIELQWDFNRARFNFRVV
ncbi:hypothetical protein CFOL_v3_27053, partial [Cephalotus follicularis]